MSLLQRKGQHKCQPVQPSEEEGCPAEWGPEQGSGTPRACSRLFALCAPAPAASSAADGNALLRRRSQTSILWLYLAKPRCTVSSFDSAHHNCYCLHYTLHFLWKFAVFSLFPSTAFDSCLLRRRRGRAGGGRSEQRGGSTHARHEAGGNSRWQRASRDAPRCTRHFEEQKMPLNAEVVPIILSPFPAPPRGSSTHLYAMS